MFLGTGFVESAVAFDNFDGGGGGDAGMNTSARHLDLFDGPWDARGWKVVESRTGCSGPRHLHKASA